MKKLFLSAIIATSLVASINAQESTNTSSQFKATVMTLTDHITTSSNWNVAIEGIYMEAAKQHWGARIDLAYKVSPNMFTTLSLAQVNGGLYGISGNFGLKQRFDIFGKGIVGVTPAAFGGAGTCLSGVHIGNFTIPGTPSGTDFFGVVGSEVCVDFPKWYYAPTLIFGYEKWSAFQGGIWSFGLHYDLDKVLAKL